MTDAQANQDMDDSHVTLTTMPLVVQQQSYFVSSDLMSKFINPSPDTGIDSILNQDTQSDTLVSVPVLVAAETPSSGTTIPQPPIPNILPLQQTPTSTTTTTNPIMTLSKIPNFASLFQFDQRVSALESEMSEFRQISQFVKAFSSIMGIVDTYLASKMKEAVDVDSTMKAIFKEQTSYVVAASLLEFELKKILIDKMEANKSIDKSYTQKNLYNALVKSYNTDKDIITLYEDPSAGSNQGSKRRRLGKENESLKELKIRSPSPQVLKKVHPNFNQNLHAIIPLDHFINNDLEYLKGGSSNKKYTTSITKTKAANYGQVKWTEDKVSRIWSRIKVVYDKHAYWGTYHWGPKRQKFYGYASNMETSKDVYSRYMIITLTNLNLEERYALNVALRMFTRCIVIQEHVEDLQLGVESYQKKINLKNPDTCRSNPRRMTPYTTYPDIQGIIYEDEMNKNRLMRTDELHKFSDGTLNHVQTALNDIALGIKMEYLPKRKWSKQDRRRACVMINAIDKKLRDRRLMRSLEKFVGERPYGGDLWLLERTI
ncbi:hypothetical protein Tco_1207584 [Tanacetum coccineum]